MERAILFLYDAERRLVLPAGSHGVYREIIAHGYGSPRDSDRSARGQISDSPAASQAMASTIT
jgi:hypothetical protein